MSDIYVFGSLNTDMTIECPRMPEAGETLAGGGFLTAPGGKGANQAVACARLGGRTHFCGRAGDDLFGRRLRENFEEAGADCTFLRACAGSATGVAVIVVTFAAIAGLFLLRGGFTEEGAGTATTSESPSADGSDPRALLEEYMSLGNRDERADWIRRHTDFDLLPNAALQDDSGLSVSPETWASMQADFYSADLADGELTVIDENYLSEEDITPEEFDAQRKELGPGITDAYEAIFDLEAGYGGANGILFVKTGDSWHYFVYSFKRRPSLDGLLNLGSHEAS